MNKLKKTLGIDTNILQNFDSIIDNYNMKRSVAICILLQNFFDDIKKNNGDALLVFLNKPNYVKDKEQTKFQISISEDLYNEYESLFIKNGKLQAVPKINFINRLLYEITLLDEKERRSLLFS